MRVIGRGGVGVARAPDSIKGKKGMKYSKYYS